jgi:hypothetical protein
MQPHDITFHFLRKMPGWNSFTTALFIDNTAGITDVDVITGYCMMNISVATSTP